MNLKERILLPLMAAGGAAAIAFPVALTTIGAGGSLIGAGSAIAVGGAVVAVQHLRRERSPLELESPSFDNLPRELREEFEKLVALYSDYQKLESPIADRLESIVTNGQQLFDRISAKQDTQTGRLAAVNYTDTLKKLNKALGKEYYLDILKHPRLWDNPERRLKAVELAVEATDNQLVKQIRQVNASQDIEYSVSIDSLINSDNPEADELLS